MFSFIALFLPLLSPPNKEVPVEEHNGHALGEEEEQAADEEEGEGVEADDEATQVETAGDEEEEEAEEETDEVTEDSLTRHITKNLILLFGLLKYLKFVFFQSFLVCSTLFFPPLSL